MRKRNQHQHQPTVAAARAHGESVDRHLELLNSNSKASTSSSTRSSGSFRFSAFTLARVDVALAALVLTVYARTLYPSVAGGDSGELVAESCHLGVSHPPGYPLFNLAVHAFATRLPWEYMTTSPTIAWRANLFSAGRVPAQPYGER